MVLGTSSPAFAAGQVPSGGVTAGTEASVSEPQDEVLTEQDSHDTAGTEQNSQNDGNVLSGQESVETQETAEGGEAGTTVGSDIKEASPEEDINDAVSVEKGGEDSKDEDRTDSSSDVEEKPEILVGTAENPYGMWQDVDEDGNNEIRCTYFAWQQVYDNTGIALPAWGNAVNWFQSAKDAGYATGDYPQPGAVAVWSGGMGHVAYVTEGSGNTFTVNEGGRIDLDHTSSQGVAYGYTLTNAVGTARPGEASGTQILLGFIYPGSESVGPEGERVSVGENVTVGYDSQTGKLTFYSQGGTLSSNWKQDLGTIWNERNTIKTITISDDSDVMYFPADSMHLFSYFNNLQSLDLSKADTSNVTSMCGMFEDCSSLQTLDVSGFDTSNVTNMGSMFSGCRSLQTLDVSGFDTSNVTNMSRMFEDCGSLQSLDVSGFDTSNVTDMSWMFMRCNNLQTLDVSGFDTSNVMSMNGMFSSCCSLQFLDVSGFNTSNVTDMYSMFWNCGGLQSLDVSGFDTSNVTNMAGMFYWCSNLQSLDVSGFDTSNVTNMAGMFYWCSNLQSLDLSGFDTSNVTYMFEMFIFCESLQELDVSNFDISNVNALNDMFLGCNSLQRLDLSSFNMVSINDAENMISCDNLLEIMTPINVQETIDLPYTFVDASGTEYDSLPQGLSESIRLTKKGADIPAGLEILSLSDDFYGKTGTTASFHIEVEGNGAISYQWQYRMAGTTSWKTPSQASAKTADYVFTLKPSYDNIEVRCIVSDDSGNEIISETRKATVFAFTSQPSDAVAEEGQVVNFEVSAIGRGVTYQWYYMRPNGAWTKATASGARTAVFPITAGTKNDGTAYKCVITDEEGNQITSAAGILTVNKSLRITGLSEDAYAVNGKSVNFHIDAVGKGTLTYQWQYRLASMSEWKAPAQASARTPDYSFNMKPSYDNIEVRCIVSDESGSEVISETRKANVFAYTSQPKDSFATEGQIVKFKVSAIGRNVTYQWYYKRPNSVWSKTTVSGSRTAILPITAGTKNDGTSYRCVITDEEGNQITSAAGTLTLETPLRITGISEDAYDVNGESVTFHIDAAGKGDLSYQWQYKLAGESKWKTPAQASAKTADYVFKLKPSYDNIEVRCIVQDASGNSVTSEVRKANVFAITGQPKDAELALGEKTTFAVKAVGKELTYQWYYMRPEGSWNKVTVAGCNTASLVITANTKNDGTEFRCHITDGLGNVLVSAAATLTQS